MCLAVTRYLADHADEAVPREITGMSAGTAKFGLGQFR